MEPRHGFRDLAPALWAQVWKAVAQASFPKRSLVTFREKEAPEPERQFGDNPFSFCDCRGYGFSGSTLDLRRTAIQMR